MSLTKGWNIVSYGLSDIGLTRHNNEDAWARDLSCHLYALADGIGGRQAGEVAAQYSVNRLCQIISKAAGIASLNGSVPTCDHMCALISDSIQQTNNEVFNLAQQNEFLHGMGTTLCSLLIHEQIAYMAHLGDSRIYILRKQELIQLTQDHKSNSSKQNSSISHTISRALGIKANIEPSISWIDLLHNDLFLLCSDGLSNALSDTKIKQILLEEPLLKDQCAKLIDSAKQNGGSDNITALLVHLK
jgi:serine/threonine protein phosphatase PrpC